MERTGLGQAQRQQTKNDLLSTTTTIMMIKKLKRSWFYRFIHKKSKRRETVKRQPTVKLMVKENGGISPLIWTEPRRPPLLLVDMKEAKFSSELRHYIPYTLIALAIIAVRLCK